MHFDLKPNDRLQTPEWVYKNLGSIDLDPCAGEHTHIGVSNWAVERGENGLEREWFGFVYCNPPFSLRALDRKNGGARERYFIAP